MEDARDTTNHDGERELGWPLHERLIGGAIRATLAAIGFVLPFALVLRARDLPYFAVGTLIFSCGVFAAERRDSRLRVATLRLYGGGVAAMLLLPVGIIWLDKLGNPRAAYGELGRIVDHVGPEAILALISGGVAGVVFGLPVLVRTKTDSARALYLSAIGPLVLPLLVLLGGAEAGAALATIAAAVLALSGVRLSDKLGARWDPARPAPRGGPVWRAIAIWAPVSFVGACLSAPLFLGSVGSHRHYGAVSAIGALKTITTSQAIFREGDKDQDSVFNYAGCLTELSEAQLVDSVLGSGVKQGYLFRVTRTPATSEFLWMAAADPISPEYGDRYFVTNHAGVIYYTTSGPIAFTDDCSIPRNVVPIGK